MSSANHPDAKLEEGRNILNAGFVVIMAKMSTCPCGWTIISPQGEGDVKKHMMMHLRDAHPGTVMTEDEIGKTIKTV